MLLRWWSSGFLHQVGWETCYLLLEVTEFGSGGCQSDWKVEVGWLCRNVGRKGFRQIRAMKWKRGCENGEFEVIQSILCEELLDTVYIATPLILSKYVSGTQSEHIGIPIWLSQCVYVFTYLLYTLLRNSITVPRAQIHFHRWVSDEWIGRVCLYGSEQAFYNQLHPYNSVFNVEVVIPCKATKKVVI
jgi:hypothetical protein